MRRWIPLWLVAVIAFAGCSNETTNPLAVDGSPADLRLEDADADGMGRIAVANRGSGSITVIDAETHQVVGDYALPAGDGEPTPEPMYVVYVAQKNRLFVGDRANNRVAAFDASTFEVVGTAPAGAGVFHMWADPQGKQLWVNNDVDNTTTVIDPKRLQVIATVPTPSDLVDQGGKPHDVIVGPKGRYAYVTVLGVAGDNDYVVQFETSTFQESGRTAVGKDPHVSLARQNHRLFVPCQNSDVVFVLDRISMQVEAEIAVPGAHGAGMASNGRYLYTTNLPGGGTDALYTIDTRTLSVVGDPVTSPYPVPHNIALTSNSKKLFVTHSGGTADKVSIYQASSGNPVPQLVDEVTVGLNPFGIAFIR